MLAERAVDTIHSRFLFLRNIRCIYSLFVRSVIRGQCRELQLITLAGQNITPALFKTGVINKLFVYFIFEP